MILAQLRTAMIAAIPGLDAPKTAFFRIARNVAGKLNLQPLSAILDQTKDLSNIEVCPGVPGVTSDPTLGETPIVAFVGTDGTPYVIARASASMPGHTPIAVYHDAKEAIWLISKPASITAKVYVGNSTAPLVHASEVTRLVGTIQALGASLSLSPVPEVAAVGVAITAAFTDYIVAPTTKLEAQ